MHHQGLFFLKEFDTLTPPQVSLFFCDISFFVCVDDRLMLCGCRSPGGPLEIGLTLLGQL